MFYYCFTFITFFCFKLSLIGRDISWCKQLISKGANPNLSNVDGWHPIHMAAYGQDHEILPYLMSCISRKIV